MYVKRAFDDISNAQLIARVLELRVDRDLIW